MLTVWSATVMIVVSVAAVLVDSLNALWVCIILVTRSQRYTAAADCIDYRERTLQVWTNLKATFSMKSWMCCCEAPGCGPHPCRSVKGVYSHCMLPSLSLRLLDNCNLPQSDSANRWPRRPTGRSCSLSMSPRSQICTAFILATVCSRAVIFLPELYSLSFQLCSAELLSRHFSV